jgi:hypothetical protein
VGAADGVAVGAGPGPAGGTADGETVGVADGLDVGRPVERSSSPPLSSPPLVGDGDTATSFRPDVVPSTGVDACANATAPTPTRAVAAARVRVERRVQRMRASGGRSTRSVRVDPTFAPSR